MNADNEDACKQAGNIQHPIDFENEDEDEKEHRTTGNTPFRDGQFTGDK